MAAQKPSFRLSVVLGVLLFILFFAAPSWAELECGAIIGPNETATLTKDLSCPGFNPALTLEASSILNLGWHTVQCVTDDTGIEITGAGSILQFGTVADCRTGVKVAGTGGHIVTKVTARDHSGTGFRVDRNSHGNRLSYNTARNSGINGFDMESDENEVSYNISIGNGRGYQVDLGNRNTLKHNLAKSNRNAGYNVDGEDTSLTKNRAISTTEGAGFIISGNRNTVIENLAKNNGNDDLDDGFEFRDNNVEVLSNKAYGNTGAGFLFRTGSGYTVLGNTAKKNQREGFEVLSGAINSTLLGNIALRNGRDDLVDDNFNCDNNTWQGNIFRTSLSNPPGCIH